MSNTRTITLSNRAPVRIADASWPVIAASSWSDNPTIPAQANRTAWLKVRQHVDGRTLVYGGSDSNWQGERSLRSGLLLDVGDDIVHAINSVASELDRHDELAADAIGDLPAEDI